MRWFSLIATGALAATLACEEERARETEQATAAATPAPPPTPAEPPKPEEPARFVIEAAGPKVGWTSILLEKKDGPEKLAQEIAAHETQVKGNVVPLEVDRKAKMSWVVQMVSALTDAGATGVTLKTKTRPEYPETVELTPLAEAKSAPRCSVVAMVLEERKNAVWQLEGGTAVRSPRGLAGPDMAMTADNLARAAKRCPKSDTFFFSADDGVEWGLAYDLAAASQTLKDAHLGHVVLLREPPVAGRPVEL